MGKRYKAMTDIVELNEQIMNSDALKIHFFLEQLNVNHYVVIQNFNDLHKFLKSVESRESFPHMWIVEKREERLAAMREITRLLLNFLASACARIESTRIMMRKRYRAQPIFKEYQGKVDETFKGNILVEFIEGLRNYSLHYALPYASARWEFNHDEGIRHYFTLGRDDLISSGFFEHKSKTPKKGRAYLYQCDQEINIREFTAEYIAITDNFHRWIDQELRHLHRDELDWLYAASRESSVEKNRLLSSIKKQG